MTEFISPRSTLSDIVSSYADEVREERAADGYPRVYTFRWDVMQAEVIETTEKVLENVLNEPYEVLDDVRCMFDERDETQREPMQKKLVSSLICAANELLTAAGYLQQLTDDVVDGDDVPEWVTYSM